MESPIRKACSQESRVTILSRYSLAMQMERNMCGANEESSALNPLISPTPVCSTRPCTCTSITSAKRPRRNFLLVDERIDDHVLALFYVNVYGALHAATWFSHGDHVRFAKKRKASVPLHSVPPERGTRSASPLTLYSTATVCFVLHPSCQVP